MVMGAQTQKANKWAELSEELVAMICESISLYVDYIRFRSVCVSWRRKSSLSKTHINHHHHPSRQRQRQFFPFVLLHCDQEEDEEDNSDTSNVGLLSIPENSKIYHPRGLLQSKEFLSMHCLGSSHGWLVMVDENTPPGSMYLINPFTKAQLPLPPTSLFLDVEYQPYRVGEECRRIRTLTQLNRSRVRKVVLSSSPSSSCQFQSSDVVAIAIFAIPDKLVFSRPGDKAWASFGSDHPFIDILFYRDHLYALRQLCSINNNESVMNYDILVFHMYMCGRYPIHPKLVETLKPPKVCHSRLGRPKHCRWGSPYLVESCGDLLIVEREEVLMPLPKPSLDGSNDLNCFKTIGFNVYKLCLGNSSSDDNKNSSTWEQTKNLGERMLFLGLNSAFSLSTYDFPPGCCRGNCIYFTHHHFGGGGFNSNHEWDLEIDEFDMGVFNLKEEHIEPLMIPLQGHSYRGHHPMGTVRPSPIWLTPNPY
ncbi:uncharacterized protein LOC122060125 [Macadamia integrifolia]|uniref:uncharacterized protein LOC122060125 n=1 Tax=Macadamia integrifolia TaxID=60698 RepID=UPI001C533F2B|nr:uncharacterized protein LOC122060125 [Macadamia integrifolia]